MADHHNYFVGRDGVLVHNCNLKSRAETAKPGQKLKTPDSHAEDFTKTRGDTWVNNKTGEKWKRDYKGKEHRGEKWDVSNRKGRVADVRENGEVARVKRKGKMVNK